MVSSAGWCNTIGNYYNITKKNETFRGWGFCNKECHSKTNEFKNHTLRVRHNVEILTEALCKRLLLKETPVKLDKVRVLCVGNVHLFSESQWIKNDDNFTYLRSVPNAKRHGAKFFIGTESTCEGFLGGALLVEESDRIVLTG